MGPGYGGGAVHGVSGGGHLDPGVAVCGVPGGMQLDPDIFISMAFLKVGRKFIFLCQSYLQ